MKYIDEFRSKKLIHKFSKQIQKIAPLRRFNIMEVCGTHTQSFFRFGLDKLIPRNLKVIAGPGCPVCVSSQQYIDSSILLARQKDTIILTFADMLRVPGTDSSLEKERARFGNIRSVYSPLDSLAHARLNPDKRVVFLAVGFETTATAIALSMLSAKKEKLKNLFFFSSLKVMPPAMEHLVKDKKLKIGGFICPGHVSAVIGADSYEPVVKKYGINCCVTGFEPLDIMEGIYLLLKQGIKKSPQVINQYSRVVTGKGNLKAQKIIKCVFETRDVYWRGLGVIRGSGLAIRDEFSVLDAEKEFSIKQANRQTGKRKTPCRCGDVLKGIISPRQCPLYLKACSPDNPVGPCMVASEGACNAYYKYKK